MLEVVEEPDPSQQQELQDAPMPSRSAVVRWLLGVLVIGVVLSSVLGLAGRFGWLFDLCTHFRFQYALILTVTTAGLALLRSKRMIWLSLAGLVLNVALIVPLYIPPAAEPDPGSATLRVMHFNISTRNDAHDDVINEILSSNADVVFLQEVSPIWIEALEEGMTGYNLVVSQPRIGAFGIACFVKEDSDVLRIESHNVLMIRAVIGEFPMIELLGEFDDQPIAFLSTHPMSPRGLTPTQQRDELLDAAGGWAAGQDVPCVIIGDFNTTPWSTAFRDMQDAGGLVNSQNGHGLSPTWPAGLGPLGMIPIDHLLHGEALVTVDRRVGRAAGSDHRPLSVDLRWRDVD